MNQTENRVIEKEDYLKDVQHLRKVFGQRSINNIVTKICTAGELIIKFKEYQASYNRTNTIEGGEDDDLN